MSEKITIDGISSHIDAWASEKTLKELLKALKDVGKLTEAQTEKIIANNKTNKDFDKAALYKDLSEAMADVNAELETSTELTKKDSKEKKKSTEAQRLLRKGLMKVTGTFVGLAGRIVGNITSQMNTSIELAKSGVRLNSTIVGVTGGLGIYGQSVIAANLTMGEMTKLTQEYGAVLNQYGILGFAKMSKGVTKDLESIGMTASEAAEMLVEYLDIQRMMGVRSRMDNHQVEEAAKRSIRRAEEWSKVLGVSRDQIIKSTRAALDQDFARSAVNSIINGGEQVSVALQTIAMGLSGDGVSGLQHTLMDAISQPYHAVASELYGITARFSPAAANAMAELSAMATAGIEDVDLSKTKAFLTAISDPSSINRARAAMDREYLALSNQAKVALDTMKRHEEGIYTNAEVMARFKNTMKPINEFFNRVMMGVMNSKVLTDGLEKLSKNLSTLLSEDKILKLSDSISNIILKLTDAIIPAIDNLLNWVNTIAESDKPSAEIAKGVGRFLGNIVKMLPWKTIAMTIGAGIVAGMVTSRALGAIGGRFMGRGAAGAGVGKLFEGIGKGASGIMMGLVKALKYAGMGAPKVALGGAAIGAAILAIGGAVAGATWMIGATLPKLTAGLKGFETIDGENLKSAGMGIAALAAGMLALTSNKLINGIGDLVTGPFRLLKGMITGKEQASGPFGFLKELSSLEMDGSGIKSMAESLDSLTAALVRFNRIELSKINVQATKELIGVLKPERTSMRTRNSYSRRSRGVDHYQQQESTAQVIERNAEVIERVTVNKNNDELAQINTYIKKQNEMLSALIANSEENIRHLKTISRRMESR